MSTDFDADAWAAQQAASERRRSERATRRAAQPSRWRPQGDRRRARGGPGLYDTGAGRALAIATAALLAVTVIGLIALWPGDRPESGVTLGSASLPATVNGVRTVACQSPTPQRCRVLVVTPFEGPEAGVPQRLTLGPVESTPQVDVDDELRVTRNAAPQPGATGIAAERYGFADFERRTPLIWLVVVFAVVAVALTRWRGVLAIAGVALSVLLVTEFLVPALLAGSSPVLVSLVGALAVMFVTLGLTYGVTAQTFAAALGIAVSLALATGLGSLWIRAAHLDGLSSDLAPVLSQASAGLSLQGVVLAGMVIGALGVLADMAVSQASAVMALRRANPAHCARRLYAGAFTVGRDHLAATVHTLVLAYVGATLPLLLVLQSGGVGASDALNTQDLAEPVVATLIGSIGLVAAVPLTTGLAALLVSRVPVAALPDDHGGHAH